MNKDRVFQPNLGVAPYRPPGALGRGQVASEVCQAEADAVKEYGKHLRMIGPMGKLPENADRVVIEEYRARVADYARAHRAAHVVIVTRFDRIHRRNHVKDVLSLHASLGLA